MLLDAPGGFEIAVALGGEQALGLLAEMLEVGLVWQMSGHGNPLSINA